MKKKIVFILCSLLIESVVAHADSVFSLSDILDNVEVVTATKQKEKAKTAPATVYVVSEDDILKNGFTELKDILTNVPGIVPISLGFFEFGGQRGSLNNFSQTLVLINGREVQNLIASEAFISRQFATHNVKRVEIVQGPGSALYGANAVVGVVNVITKNDQQDFNKVETSVDVGAHGTKALNIVFGKKIADFRLSGAMRMSNTGFYDMTQYVGSNSNVTQGFNLTGAPNWSIRYKNEHQAFPLSLKLEWKDFYVGRESFWMNLGKGLENVAWDYSSQFDHRQFEMNYVGWQHSFTEAWGAQIEYQHSNEKFWGRNLTASKTTPVTDGNADSDIDQEDVFGQFTSYYSQEASSGSTRDKVSGQFNGQWAGVNLIGGLVYDVIDAMGIAGSASNPVPLFDESRSASNPLRLPVYQSKKKSVYLQTQNSFFDKTLHLTLGGRYDDQNFYGGVSTLRSGLVYSPLKQTTFKFLFGQAFREPTVFDRGAQSPSGVNMSLKPMKADTFEFGVNQSLTSDLVVSGVIFKNYFRDRIVPLNTYDFTNSTATQMIAGGELQLFYRFFDRFSGELNYAYADAGKTNFAGQDIKNLGIYMHRVNFSLNYDVLGLMNLNARINYFGSVRAKHGNPSINEVIDLNAATLLNLTASTKEVKLGDGLLKGYLTVTNVTNKEWSEPNVRQGGPRHFPQAGREWIARLAYEY